MTPFLRWETGDYVSYYERGETEGPLSIYPMIRHAARTSGFFKVRGININHADFEDFMHRRLDIADFKVEIEETKTLDLMRISVEVSSGSNDDQSITTLKRDVRKIFEMTPEIEVLKAGTLEKELMAQVKQQRFIDKRI
jgi:phenylacetate-CoA ligase